MKKEIVNVSVQFVMEDAYKYSDWKEEYGLINEGYILRIPIKGESGATNAIGTYKLIDESDDKLYKVGQKDNNIEIEFFCTSAELEMKLHKYNINQCELVLIMYLNTYAVADDDSEVFEYEQIEF